MSILLPLPDKYIRKALFALLNNIVVDTNVIRVYDTRVSGSIPQAYILMTTQTNQVNRISKCGDIWQSSILLDIVTRYDSTGNPGNRELADNICEAVRNLLETNLVLDGGLNVLNQELDFPSDISTVTQNENVFRKFIRIELDIN